MALTCYAMCKAAGYLSFQKKKLLRGIKSNERSEDSYISLGDFFSGKYLKISLK